ncbi:MAG: AbrB/MazE/SpoVT family DNA-binding domain-containing protein [Candidatus Saccharimonadales bacterium]
MSVTVKLSSKSQITIPKRVRTQLGIKLGDSLRVATSKDGKITLEPQKTIVDYFGKFEGQWSGKDSRDPVEIIRERRDQDG